MKFRILMLLAIGSLLALPSFAQDAGRNCASNEVHERLLSTDPGYAARQADIESFTAAYLANHAGGTRTVVTIPVVVHVVYNTATENISDAQINSQLDVLNEDFRRLNADASETLAEFTGVAADAEIEFCLASVDPDGNPTSGITRTSTASTSFSYLTDNVKFNATGGHDAWPATDYLNMWVCDISGGILGYAQFPGGPAATDGVVIDYAYMGTIGTATFPFDLGRTATHEVGHWLNLRHIWGDGGCGIDDFCADTPESDGPNYGCNLSTISCSTLDMVQNYMDYSDDACMNLFTLDQKDRMQALFAAGGARESLLSSGGCGGGTGGTCDIPTGLTVSGLTTSSVTLSWDAVAGASGYRIQVNNESTGENRRRKVLGTSITISGPILSAGTTYAWGVKTLCESASSDWSGPDYFTVPVRMAVGNSETMLVYPNPGNGSFRLSGWSAENTDANVLITDLTGRVISSFNLNAARMEDPASFTLDAPAGMYLLQVTGNQCSFVETLIKE